MHLTTPKYSKNSHCADKVIIVITHYDWRLLMLADIIQIHCHETGSYWIMETLELVDNNEFKNVF